LGVAEVSRRRDHYPRINGSFCPDAEACKRLYHGLGGPDGDDTCECCGSTIAEEIADAAPRLGGVRRAREAAWLADQAFRRACVQALEDHPLRQVAMAAGKTRQTIYNWAEEARR
jgi:hypothetical protein